LLGERAIPLRHDGIEISDTSSVRVAFSRAHPDFVINTAAYNYVDKAEDEHQAAFQVNSLGTRNLAQACAHHSIPLLHVSTDYVFGAKRLSAPIAETEDPAPLNAYGMSKLAGENFVLSTCPKHFVVRTCGLYGHAESAGKGNFVKTVLRLGREKGQVRVVSDQVCTPTSTADLAPALLKLIETQAYGLYHLTNEGSASWFEFAREIFQVAGLEVTVDPITTQEFGAKARRPSYSVLDCHKAAAVIGEPLPTWQDALNRYVKAMPNAGDQK
jgi:dTDP-4-dehydrorhamnose reductase